VLIATSLLRKSAETLLPLSSTRLGHWTSFAGRGPQPPTNGSYHRGSHHLRTMNYGMDCTLVPRRTLSLGLRAPTRSRTTPRADTQLPTVSVTRTSVVSSWTAVSWTPSRKLAQLPKSESQLSGSSWAAGTEEAHRLNASGERFWRTLLANASGERFWRTLLANADGESRTRCLKRAALFPASVRLFLFQRESFR
jgi:hypothetical protein